MRNANRSRLQPSGYGYLAKLPLDNSPRDAQNLRPDDMRSNKTAWGRHSHGKSPCFLSHHQHSFVHLRRGVGNIRTAPKRGPKGAPKRGRGAERALRSFRSPPAGIKASARLLHKPVKCNEAAPFPSRRWARVDSLQTLAMSAKVAAKGGERCEDVNTELAL